jgi:hypothetical protein
MITTKIYQLTTFDVEDLTNCVLTVSWSVTAPLGINGPDGEPMTESIFYKSTLDLPQNSTSFINYSDLTEQQVIAWIETKPEYTETIKKLELKVKTTQSPPQVQPLPWAQ